jgi:hypothetical protein
MRIATGKLIVLFYVAFLGVSFVSAQGPAAAPPAAQGPGPGAGGRQAGPPQNLKVLPKDWSRQQVQQLMQTFVESLGVGAPAGEACGHCHTVDPNAPPPPPGRGPQMDFALDTNETKDVARKMIQMTMAVNADYLKDVGEATKKEKVTCYTCHHGEKTPALAPAAGWARGNFTLIPPGPTVPARGAGGRGGREGAAPPAAPPGN